MDLAKGSAAEPMLTAADLAARPDFRLGDAVVSPSTRIVRGPGGNSDVEPRVMQVLVVLADAAGQVVTRETLFSRCWGSVYVGDDSLNRAVAGVRRIASEIAGGSFSVETVPRTGYRLTGKLAAKDAVEESWASVAGLSRRTVVAGSAVALAGAGAFGLWFDDSRRDAEFADLMSRGEQALAYGDPAGDPAARYFRGALQLRPDDARALGLFAVASMRLGLTSSSERSMVTSSSEGNVDNALAEANAAARAALAIDPNEPNARLAMTSIQRSMLDFAATEDRVRAILETDPQNTRAMRMLWNVLQCVGRSREGLTQVERALRIEPLGAANNFPRAQFLWILGRNSEADRVIDNAMGYWPNHRYVRFARFTILAFTGRARAALAMIENPKTAPQQYSPEAIALWRLSLKALDERSPANIAAAVRANVDAAANDLSLTSQAVLALSAFGEVDAAFQLANALFVVPASTMPYSEPGSENQPARSTAWRFTPWLFTPPTASLRSDSRFGPLCDAAGLTEYWARRGIRPDYQLGLA